MEVTREEIEAWLKYHHGEKWPERFEQAGWWMQVRGWFPPDSIYPPPLPNDSPEK